MSLKSIRGGVVVEIERSFLYVKLWSFETFVSFERDGGPAAKRVVFDRS